MIQIDNLDARYLTHLEQALAAKRGRDALCRLATATAGFTTARSFIVRNFLLSVYRKGNPRVDLSDIDLLDWGLRKDLVAVLLAIDGPGFSRSDIPKAYIAAGDTGARWFLAESSAEGRG